MGYYLAFSFIATQLYCRVERGIVKVGGLAPEHITMTLASLNEPFWSECRVSYHQLTRNVILFGEAAKKSVTKRVFGSRIQLNA